MDSDQKDLIKRHYEEYKKIGYIECPAFGNEKIYFKKKGFRHYSIRIMTKEVILNIKEDWNC